MYSQKIAFFCIQEKFANQLQNEIGFNFESYYFEEMRDLLNFIWDETSNNEIGNWKTVILDWNKIRNKKYSLTDLKEIILDYDNIYFIFLFNNCKQNDEIDLISELEGVENVHFVSRGQETLPMLKDCIKGIEHHGKMSWLISRSQNVGGLIDSFTTENITSQEVLGNFIEKVKFEVGAESVGIFYIRADGDFESLYRKSEINQFKIKLSDCVQNNIKFKEGGVTYSDQRIVKKILTTVVESLIEQKFLIVTAAVFGDEPVIVVYLFSSKLENQSDIQFLRLLCNIVSREMVHFLYLRNLERLKNVIEQLSLSLNLEPSQKLRGSKELAEFEELVDLLKSYFYADGIAFLIFENQLGEKEKFRSISFERARKKTYQFSADRQGFTNYAFFQNKALLINDIMQEKEPPIGCGFAFDVFNLKADQGKYVELETFRREDHIEDESSLMYYPIKLSNIQMVIKLSNFGMKNGFSLPQLKFLELASSLIGTMIFNLENLRKITGKLDDKELQIETLNKAEQLYFYREISLSVLHQLKNYLNTINSSLLVIEMDAEFLQGKTKQELLETVEKISERLKNASKILNRAFERGSKLKPVIRKYELVEDILRKEFLPELEKRAKSENIFIEKAFTNQKYYVEVDNELLRESLFNIVDNAVYAIKSNKSAKRRIFVGLAKSRDNQFVEILIEDSGIGIQPEHIPQVFNPLFSTKGEGGTGWGLFFAQKMIEEHFKGKISVAKSQVLKGTTFLIKLPLCKEI